MSDITQYPMKSGRVVGEDGNVYNIAEIMAKASGAKPLDGVSADVTQYDNESGRVVGENGNVYNVVDLLEGIEDEIKDLSKLTKWLGETTTPLYEGSTANPIVISGVSITATQGNVAKYQSDHFIFSEADTWQPYDDTLDVYTKDESDARYLQKAVFDVEELPETIEDVVYRVEQLPSRRVNIIVYKNDSDANIASLSTYFTIIDDEYEDEPCYVAYPKETTVIKINNGTIKAIWFGDTFNTFIDFGEDVPYTLSETSESIQTTIVNYKYYLGDAANQVAVELAPEIVVDGINARVTVLETWKNGLINGEEVEY